MKEILMNKDSQTSGRNISIVIFLSMIAKTIAIIRQMVLTYFYGAGSISDAYILSQSITNTLFLLISTAIGVSFTPVFLKIKKDKGYNESLNFSGNILSLLLIISTIIIVLTLIYSNKIVFIFAKGFKENTANTTALFLRISVFSIYFVGMIGVFSSFLKIKGDYFSPSILGIALSIVEIPSFYIAAKVDDIFLPIGVLLATIVQWVIVVVASKKKGFKFYPQLNLKSKYLSRVVILSLPIMIGLGVDQINVIIDRNIASTFSSGSISSLTYANTIVSIIHTLIAVSINSVVFVEVSKNAFDSKKELVIGNIFKGLETTLLLLIPTTIGLISFSTPIVKILYERGNFDNSQTIITSEILIFYAIYLIPNGIRLIIQSYFYAYGKTKFCMYAGLIAVAVNISFNIFLSRYLGVKGLALATSLGIIVSSIILFIKFIMDNDNFPLRKFNIQVLKICICSLLMIIPSIFVFSFLEVYMSIILSLFITIITACTVYFSLAYLFGIINKDVIINIVNNIIRR